MEITAPIRMSFVNGELRYLIMRDNLDMPRAMIQIEVKNQNNQILYATELVSASKFSIRHSRENLLTTFTATIDDAIHWNPRVKPDLINVTLKNNVKIYYGELTSGGTWEYAQIFTGTLTSFTESYAYGSNVINISGENNASHLRTAKDNYGQYVFWSKQLLQWWCEDVGIEYDLNYAEDYVQGLYMLYNDISEYGTRNVHVAYDSVYDGITDILQLIGPRVEGFFDFSGKLVVREVFDESLPAPEYYYTPYEMTGLTIGTVSQNIYTRIVLHNTGNTKLQPTYEFKIDEWPYLQSKWPQHYNPNFTMEERYGIVERNFSSPFFVSIGFTTPQLYMIEHYRDMFFSDGLRRYNTIDFSIPINPYLYIGSVVQIVDNDISGIGSKTVRITAVEHNYAAASAQTSKVTGYFV